MQAALRLLCEKHAESPLQGLRDLLFEGVMRNHVTKMHSWPMSEAGCKVIVIELTPKAEENVMSIPKHSFRQMSIRRL